MLSKKMKLISLVLGVVLAGGCQQHGTTQTVVGTNETSSAPENAEQKQGQSQAQQTVITVHLAQEKLEPSLMLVDLGDNRALYALSQPVLTQADMREVTPVTAQNGSTFIMFDLNAQGRTKLASVSAQAQGHYFLVSAKGQLISVAKITEPMTDGQLLISTNSAEHSRQIIQLLR
ncbi:MAG: hypothetical protein RBS14_01730 [Atribacterota bacterium]|jgi:preprotein translocase subunit SecD|nr:hypothetical protein [Atribacterota bacterium]